MGQSAEENDMSQGGLTKCGEIIWDEEKGYGYVSFEKTFCNGDPTTCLDAISDWTTGLTNEYNDQLKRSQAKFKAISRQNKRVSKK